MNTLPCTGALLAAGLGTRLSPLTDHCPKPLVPIVGVPLLEYALDALARAGITRIGVNLFHLADQIPPALAHRPESLSYVVEETLAGTGGGLRGIARRLPRGTILACNGDALFDFDLAAALAAHRASGASATLVLRRPRPEDPYGRVAVDSTGQIQRIAEVRGREPERDDLTFGIYTGVQLVEPDVVDALPPSGACDVLRTAYARRLGEGARMGAHFVPDDALWLDVGTPERLLAAQAAVLDRMPHPGDRHASGLTADGLIGSGHPPSTEGNAPPAWRPAGDRQGPGMWVAAEARVASGATLEGPGAVLAGAVVGRARLGRHVVVDRGASVADAADLENVLVWRGARAEGHLRDCIVLPDGTLVAAGAGG